MTNPEHTQPQPRLTPLRPRDQRHRPDPREKRDPLAYDHPYPSMADLARRLAVHTDSPRTRHSYYRDIRLLHPRYAYTHPQSPPPILHASPISATAPSPSHPSVPNSRAQSVSTRVSMPSLRWRR